VLALIDKNIEFPGNNVIGRGCTTSKVGINGVRVVVGVVSGEPAPTKVGVNVNVGCGCAGATVDVSLGTGVSVGNSFNSGVGVASKAIISGMAEQATSKNEKKTAKSFLINGGFICPIVQLSEI